MFVHYNTAGHCIVCSGDIPFWTVAKFMIIDGRTDFSTYHTLPVSWILDKTPRSCTSKVHVLLPRFRLSSYSQEAPD